MSCSSPEQLIDSGDRGKYSENIKPRLNAEISPDGLSRAIRVSEDVRLVEVIVSVSGAISREWGVHFVCLGVDF